MEMDNPFGKPHLYEKPFFPFPMVNAVPCNLPGRRYNDAEEAGAETSPSFHKMRAGHRTTPVSILSGAV